MEERFLYDAVGNRLGAARATNTYDASNELLSTSNASYTYDANGNLSTVSGTSPASYTWNPLGQMVASSDGTTFTYDYMGRRVSKGTTFYVYDGADIVLQVNADGTGAGRFVHGPGTDEHLAVRKGGVWYYYEQDGLGSVTSLTDATGNLAAAYSYTAFGKSKRELGTLNQPYRYTGREWDNETGLYYYRARYYDPTVGRFISEDPISFDGGNNFYAYVQNEPLTGTDPWGLRDPNAQERQRILDAARDWARSNVPYVAGARTKKGADCSGAVWGIYQDADLPYDYLTSGAFNKSPGPSFRLLEPGDAPEPGDVGVYSGHVVIYDPDAGATPKGLRGDVWSASHTGGPVFGVGVSTWYGPVRWVRYDVK